MKRRARWEQFKAVHSALFFALHLAMIITSQLLLLLLSLFELLLLCGDTFEASIGRGKDFDGGVLGVGDVEAAVDGTHGHAHRPGKKRVGMSIVDADSVVVVVVVCIVAVVVVVVDSDGVRRSGDRD